MGVRTRPIPFWMGDTMKLHLLAAAAVASMGLAGTANATVNLPVPSNAYITIGGLDWAWAAPCGAVNSCGDITLAYQGGQGWRLPTAAEFAIHPVATDFVFAGANVPLGGSDGVGNKFQAGSPGGAAACAAAYFSTAHTHCDWSDGLAGNWYNPSIPGGQGVPETLVVRFNAGGAVPEPATWALMITGFGLVGATLRRRRAVAA